MTTRSDQSADKGWINTKTAAWIANTSPSHIARLAKTGRVAARWVKHRGKRQYRVLEADVRAWAKQKDGAHNLTEPDPRIDKTLARVLKLCMVESQKTGNIRDIFFRAGVHPGSYRNWCRKGNATFLSLQAVANALGYRLVVEPLDRPVGE